MNTIRTAAVVLLVMVASARAGGLDDFNRGLAAVNHGDNDMAISLLSRALSGGDLSSDLQPVALVDRGVAYFREHKYPEAISDYDAALKLKPQYFEALSGRVYALAASGDKAAAASDCQRTMKIWPSNGGTDEFCGRLDWEMGDYSRAATEFETALGLNPRSPYYFLWLCLALLHTEPEPKCRLHQYARTLDTDNWPAPLIDLYLGNDSLERAQRAASDGDDETRRNRACEVGFYGGEWQLLHGNAAAGRALLKQATDLCPETYIESEPAKFELKRLSDEVTR